jgi:hypothetical protein
MSDGMRKIDVRLSMAYYFIMRMNLDLEDLPPARVQLSLHNISDIRKSISEAKSESKRGIIARQNKD